MAEVKEEIDWNDAEAMRKQIPKAKGDVTRACTAITKLLDRPFTYATPAAWDDARTRLQTAYDHCLALHK